MILVAKMTSAPRIWRNALQSLKSSSSMVKDLPIHPSKLRPPKEASDNQIPATRQTPSSSFTALVYSELCSLLCQLAILSLLVLVSVVMKTEPGLTHLCTCMYEVLCAFSCILMS
jgi:hypothetical protein